METHRSVKTVLTVSYVLQIASSAAHSQNAYVSTELILHTYVQNLVHCSFLRFSFSFYLVFERAF